MRFLFPGVLKRDFHPTLAATDNDYQLSTGSLLSQLLLTGPVELYGSFDLLELIPDQRIFTTNKS